MMSNLAVKTHLNFAAATVKSILAKAIIVLSIMALPSIPAGHAGQAPDWLEELKAGSLVIYFRHAATTRSGVDRIEWPRHRQRLLSDEGEAQSRLIGESIAALGIPVGEVLASPFARCRDMAEIAFGRVDERMELIGLLSDADGREARTQFLQNLVQAPTGDEGNRVIVSHRSNIAAVAGVSLGEGDAVLIRPLADGAFDVLAELAPSDWADLAATATTGH